MPNRLVHESSPYLLQHANNPVDWFPWCDEAFKTAASQDKPVFLSIGYSACHWCHVMEHESFENQQIADYLNKHFISIKVDREERPEIDQIYMQAVVALTGQGGWPLSAFLTPDQKFFFGGTYWPPQQRFGMPGFDHVLNSVHDAYHNRRKMVEQQSAQITQMLADQWTRFQGPSETGTQLFTRNTISLAIEHLQKLFDLENGGFGSAPKFPHPIDLQVLIRALDYAAELPQHSRFSIQQMIDTTLTKMAYGGIYDHLGGGFARYSVDAKWLVPHFEKMLYDNALLATVYLNAFQTTGNQLFRQVTEQTLEYILNYLTDSAGGFHSAEDADSEGVEGKFYIWEKAEILEALGDDLGESFCQFFGVTDAGNFEGANILNVTDSFAEFAASQNLDEISLGQALQQGKQTLLAIRDQRIRPAKDDKVLVSWNALTIDALANAAIVFESPVYLQAAQRAAHFVNKSMSDSEGRLLHTWRLGTAKLRAYLDDHSFLINALVSLYEADFDERWIEWASELCEFMIQYFSDSGGGFFFTADDHEALIVRTRDLQDSSIPSGNSMAAFALIRMGRLCGRSDWIELGEQTIRSAATLIEKAPMASGQMLLALDLALRENRQYVLMVNTPLIAARSVIRHLNRSREFGDSLVVSTVESTSVTQPLRNVLSGKSAIDGEPSLYVCMNYTCQQPLVGATEIDDYLKPAKQGEAN